ncbi:MAG: glycosyltransferase [Candidatus Caldarchaeum sp.]
MRLVFLIPSLGIGGAERAVALLANELSKSIEVSVCLFRGPIDHLVESPVYVLESFRRASPNWIARLSGYLRFLRCYRPDAVISSLTSANTLNMLSGYGGKRFLWFQNYPSNLNIRHPIFRVIHDLKFLTIYRGADGIISASEGLRDALVNMYRVPHSKTYVLPNPINLNMINKMSREPLTCEEEALLGDPTLINIGRLTWQKGQWHLIRSFNRVVKELKEARLLIVGGGSLERKLLTFVEKLGLEGKVIILGARSNPFKFLARSDLFCFPSLKEGFGMALVESLACGVPAMSSDCMSGPREILAPGTQYYGCSLRAPYYAEYGILMPVPDGIIHPPTADLTIEEKVWADTMIQVLQDSSLLKRYRERGPIRAKDYDVTVIAKMLLNILVNS